MPYTRVNWADSPSTATPVDAANLNNMDAYIATLDTRTGNTPQMGDKLAGSGNPGAGINASAGVTELGGATAVILKFNNYYDGTNDRYTTTNFAAQLQLDATGETGLRFRTAASGTAGTVITWGAWKQVAVLDSAGGGAAGAKDWTGTTDPGGSAGEGDVWRKG